MSAWKSTLMLPTLFLSSSEIPATGRPGRAPAADPNAVGLDGFWRLERRFGKDLHVAAETWFSPDGHFETRTWLESNGEVERHHAYGTWMPRKDAFVTMPSPTASRTLGDVTAGYDETGCDRITVGTRMGVPTLFLDLGEELGSFVSASKGFSLPDLFAGEFAPGEPAALAFA